METTFNNGDEAQVQRRIDWADMTFALVLGALVILIKLAEVGCPSLHISRLTTDDIASLLTVGYIIARARRQPEKLDDWGITTRLTPSALLVGFLLLGLAIAPCAAGGIAAAGRLSFEPFYITQMLEYILSAFPQQFILCSVGLGALSTLRPFRGLWRLPLLVGVLFSLAHFWTPARIPGTFVPIQMPLTLVAGFCAAFYFLKFRSILPLTAIHAIIYPLLHNWIELHL
jgi:hypothetical protein